jgi:hypothetical protein
MCPRLAETGRVRSCHKLTIMRHLLQPMLSQRGKDRSSPGPRSMLGSDPRYTASSSTHLRLHTSPERKLSTHWHPRTRIAPWCKRCNLLHLDSVDCCPPHKPHSLMLLAQIGKYRHHKGNTNRSLMWLRMSLLHTPYNHYSHLLKRMFLLSRLDSSQILTWRCKSLQRTRCIERRPQLRTCLEDRLCMCWSLGRHTIQKYTRSNSLCLPLSQ